jgi:hypothetical protein
MSLFKKLAGLIKGASDSTATEDTKAQELDSSAYEDYVESFYSDSEYKINFKEVTCTCPDFQNQRSGFQPTDPKRFCKHLLSYCMSNELIKPESVPSHAWNELQVAYEDERGFPFVETLEETINDLEVVAYVSLRGYPWVNVYVDEEDRRGYNVKEYRWAYKDAPKNSQKIALWVTKEWNDINDGQVPLPESPTQPLETKGEEPAAQGRTIVSTAFGGFTIRGNISGKAGAWVYVDIAMPDDEDYFTGSYSVKDRTWGEEIPPDHLRKSMEIWLLQEWERINPK